MYSNLVAIAWGLLVLSSIACLSVAANLALWQEAYLDSAILGTVGLALLWKQYHFSVRHEFRSVGQAERKFFLGCLVAFSLLIVGFLIWWFGTPDHPIPSQFGEAAFRIRQALPSIIVALAVLVIGWLGVQFVTMLLRRGLRRLNFQNQLTRWTPGGEGTRAIDVEQWFTRTVFWLLMLLVLVVFFQMLGLAVLTEPLTRLLNQVAKFLPRLLGAGLLLLIAWLLASMLRLLIARSLAAIDFDNRISRRIPQGERPFSPSSSLGATVYWLVLLLFLPAILAALQLPGLTAPIQAMLKKAVGFLPNIFTAALILTVGWFVAKALQRIVTGLLASAGADLLSERAGLAPALGPQGLSNMIGLIIYTLILIPVLIASLNALDLEALAEPASNMLNTLLAALPAILAATLVLALAYVVGRVIAGLIANFLASVGFNAMLPQMGRVNEQDTGGRSPSEVVGYLVLVALMLFAAVEAAHQLSFVLLAELIAGFIVFCGQIILGLIIFGIGLYLADLAARTLRASSTVQAGLLATTARLAIMVLAGAMALRQMGLGSEIINIAFGLLFGAVVVALAIALGLGSQDIAAHQLNEWIESMRSQRSRRTSS